MRYAVILALLLAGCSGGPAAPSTPPEPQYPNMVGGWGGTGGSTWTIIGGGTGAETCNATWLISGQDRQSFAGSYTMTPLAGAECGSAGSIQGSVTTGGEVRVSLRNNNGAGTCTMLSGDSDYTGFVSNGGGLTIKRDFMVRCPSIAVRYGGPATLDYRVSATISLNRR